MAAEVGMRVDVAKLLDLGDDTVGLLGESKDGEALAQACAGARMLRSACRSESGDLEVQLKVRDELDSLDSQSASIEQRKDAVRKKEKDMMKAQNMLSMCVSVTNIMPNFEDKDKVSGYIVDKNMKKLQRFEFEKTTPPVDICNKLWKMV
ncbi:hypothetical protein E2562_002679 [Oryza meyeriana var. granulata]|uniref:Uncharacterized protein n=1 Tax=Oryza meyeriana var. granulata TaxID=110450 RepID=A0A6G1BPH6_9ORYZ|nr:hypothetical protein E2562_002679 [Oryza meyeriana var. granulata]